MKQLLRLFSRDVTPEDNHSNTLNFPFHSFTSHKWQKGEIKHEKKEARDVSWKPPSEAPAILLEDFLNCIFIYEQKLGFCVSCVLFGRPCAVWGPVCSSRFFMTILWSCPTTDTFLWTTNLPFAKHTVLSLSTMTANLNNAWEIKQYTQQSDTIKKTDQMSHIHNSIFNEHRQEKATGKKRDFV